MQKKNYFSFHFRVHSNFGEARIGLFPFSMAASSHAPGRFLGQKTLFSLEENDGFPTRNQR